MLQKTASPAHGGFTYSTLLLGTLLPGTLLLSAHVTCIWYALACRIGSRVPYDLVELYNPEASPIEDERIEEECMDTTETRANEILSRLLAGNKRFANNQLKHPHQNPAARIQLFEQQRPDTIILTCSDSRIVPEIIFDQGLGDIFSIRSVGHVADDAAIESIEYAVTQLRAGIIMVLGHQHCGGVRGAIHKLRHGSGGADSVILSEVGKSVRVAIESDVTNADDIERVHVAQTLETLIDKSEAVRQAVANGEVRLVGARYVMETGLVEVLSF